MAKRKAKKPQTEFDYEADVRKQVEADLAKVEAEFPGDPVLFRMCNQVRSALQVNSAGCAANIAFHLGSLSVFRRFSRDGTFRAAVNQRRRTKKKTQTEQTKAEGNAKQAHDMLEEEKHKAGKYFNHPDGIAEVARQLDVSLRTVNRRLEDYRTLLAKKQGQS